MKERERERETDTERERDDQLAPHDYLTIKSFIPLS